MSTHSRSRHGWSLRRPLLVGWIGALGALVAMPAAAPGTVAATPAAALGRSRPAHRSREPIAFTRDGIVQGFTAGGVDKFLGIP